jgi:hypothetical protein
LQCIKLLWYKSGVIQLKQKSIKQGETMTAIKLSGAKAKAQRLLVAFQAVVLATASMVPMALTSGASAAPQLPNREAQITTARPSQTFDIVFEFDTTTLGSATAVQSAEFEFCDAPLGTCNTSNIPTVPASSTVNEGGWTTTNEATAFGSYARQNGDNGGTNNQIQVTRTDTDDQRTLTNVNVSFTGLTHNATANRTFYPRIRLYSDGSATTLVWEGAVAQSTSQTLTVNARVQEVLRFCVGTTAAANDNATSSVGADCSAVSGSTVDLGVIDSGSTSVTPVASANGGSDTLGVAMVRTNANGGVVIDYQAIQDTSSGKLKVAGATCSGTSTTDQCFNSTGTTQKAIVSGTEEFGMAIAGINCGSTSSYTCNFGAGTYNLIRDNDYDGDLSGQNNTGYVTEAGSVAGTTVGEYAWKDTVGTDRIASSAGSSTKVVDDETMMLKFAATSSITTPTGQYTVQADFIATPTF